jgi:hypothetical protein
MGGAGAAATSALATFISAATPHPPAKSVAEAESTNPKPGNLWRMTRRKRGCVLALPRPRSIRRHPAKVGLGSRPFRDFFAILRIFAA